MTAGAGIAPDPALPAAAAESYVISAPASLVERRLRSLKHGDSFGVFDPTGDILPGSGNPDGLYHRDTRHLSQLILTLNGLRPILLSSTLRDDNATLTCDLTNPDLADASGKAIEHDLLHLRRMRFLWQASCHERLTLRHFGLFPQHLRLGIAFAADFADLFEVRGTPRAVHGTYHHVAIERQAVELAYTGLDGRRRRTRVRFSAVPEHLSGNGAWFDLLLEPGCPQHLDLQIECDSGGEDTPRRSPPHFLSALLRARRSLRSLSSRATAIASSRTSFNEAIRRSVSDLYTLVTETPDGPYPYAGIPWFSTVFGRDALITALQTLWLDPSIARGVLCHLARHQATRFDEAADAEPGKILHEMRHGEMALLGEVPFRCYYGSVDSTPLFVLLAGAYLARTDDVDTLRGLYPHVEAALRWMDGAGDRDGDGFIEYGRRRPSGLVNQGWKDSHDSIFHADGTMAQGPVALVEVQAYAWGAWRAAAAIAARLGEPEAAQRHAKRAEILRHRFDEAFFDEALGTYVLALDGAKRPCRVRTSNAGHALFTGIALPQRAAAVAHTLCAPASYSGWGVRTLATTEARYNPMSYHNGSVWPHDNAIVAAGLARYGFRREAARIFASLFAASGYLDLRRLPELFCGFARERSRGPTSYPVACSPQAWAAATPLSLLQSCLGLGFDLERHTVVLDQPLLPDFLDDLFLHRVALGMGSLDLTLRRRGGDISVEVTGRNGRLGLQLT